VLVQLIFYGATVGLGAAIAPGPINLEIVRRAITRGPRFGFAFGMGAVTADLTYLSLAVLGAAAVITAMPVWGKVTLSFLGTALLFYIGIRVLRLRPQDVSLGPDESEQDIISPDTVRRRSSLLRNYLLGLALTLSSPTTFLYWLGISVFAAQHFSSSHAIALPLTLGVGGACTCWVTCVVLLAGRFHRRISPRTVLVVERVIGASLIAFALLSAMNGVRMLLGTQ
jgi:threonine/homoserine/homoserine lactone efflux protein